MEVNASMPFNLGDKVELTKTILNIPAGSPGVIKEIVFSNLTQDGLAPLFPYTVDFPGVSDGEDWPMRRDEIRLATYDPDC